MHCGVAKIKQNDPDGLREVDRYRTIPSKLQKARHVASTGERPQKRPPGRIPFNDATPIRAQGSAAGRRISPDDSVADI